MNHLALGRRAYEGYCRATGGVSLVSGAKLPEFHELSAPIRDAWCVAAIDVALVTLEQGKQIALEAVRKSAEYALKLAQQPGFDTKSAHEG
jgi:hypothetical protein